MKRRTVRVLFFALFVAAVAGFGLAGLCLPGCTPLAAPPGSVALTPRQQLQHRLSLAEESFRVGLDATHEAVVLGLLKPADLKPWVPVEQGIGTALSNAESVASDPSRTDSETEIAVAAAESALPKLAPLLNWVGKAKAAVPPAPVK